MFHQERIIGLQTFSDPGSTLPEKQGTSALVGNSRNALYCSVFTFCALDCLLHLDPVKPIVVEESAVLHLPDAIEKIVRNLFEWDPSVLNVTTIPPCDHRLDTTKNHQGGYRWVEKADVGNLQDGNERANDQEHDSSANPRYTSARFPRHHLELRKFIRNESIPIDRGRPIVRPH